MRDRKRRSKTKNGVFRSGFFDQKKKLVFDLRFRSAFSISHKIGPKGPEIKKKNGKNSKKRMEKKERKKTSSPPRTKIKHKNGPKKSAGILKKLQTPSPRKTNEKKKNYTPLQKITYNIKRGKKQIYDQKKKPET